MEKWRGTKAGHVLWTVLFGCGIYCETNTIFFTWDGEVMDGAGFTDVRGRLFPVIRIFALVDLETNFTGPFRWSREGKTAAENER